MRHRAYWESRRPDTSQVFVVGGRALCRSRSSLIRASLARPSPARDQITSSDGQAFPVQRDDSNGNTCCTGNAVPPAPLFDVKWRRNLVDFDVLQPLFAGKPIARSLPPVITMAILAGTGCFDDASLGSRLPRSSPPKPVTPGRFIDRVRAVDKRRLEGERLGDGKRIRSHSGTAAMGVAKPD
jgi:hypothetical protein